MGNRELNQRLQESRSPRELARICGEEARRRIGVSGINIHPFLPGIPAEQSGYMWSDESSIEGRIRAAAENQQLLQTELGEWSQLFDPDHTSFDASRRFGAALQRTRIYNDVWRPHKMDRHMLAGLGAPFQPLGFIALSRAGREKPFTERDVMVLEEIRVALGTRLRTVLDAERQPGVPWSILDSITETLPFPVGLFDAQGRVLWLNRAALLRLRVAAYQTGDRWMFSAAHPNLQSWGDLARWTAARHQGTSTDACRTEAILERSGEKIVARFRPAGQGGAPVVTISLLESNPGPPSLPEPGRLRRAGLTAREAEVALLLGDGHTVLNVALRLGIKESTVQTHLKRIYRKLRVANRVELVHCLTALDPAAPTGGQP